MREKFENYYETFAPKLMGYLIANGTSHDNACEIVQESFLKLWKIRDTLDEEVGRVAAILWTIARNLRADRFRKDKRIVYDPEAGIDRAAKAAPQSEKSDDELLRNRLKDAFSKLPPLLRESYLMFHVAEFSVRDIALQMNTTETVVKVRIHRAKLKLQEMLKDLHMKTTA